MTSPPPLPPHLEQLGEQLKNAARQRERICVASPQRRRRRSLAAISAVLVAAAVAAILLITATGPETAPAYALTRHSDGSITITLSDLTTGIPALNSELKALGIDETVIPIRADCHSPNGSGHVVMHPDPHYEYDGSVSATITARSARRMLPGFHGVLAAMRLPNGKILAFIGGLSAPVPTCLPYDSTPTDSLAMLSTP
jgi:hypothetical protein